MCEKSCVFDTFLPFSGAILPSAPRIMPAHHKVSKTQDFSSISAHMCEKSRVFDLFLAPSLQSLGVLIPACPLYGVIKCQKHEPFHQFRAKCEKSLVFSTFYWRHLYSPAECSVRPARHKVSKTWDFSHIWAEIDEKSCVFDTLPVIKCQKDKTFLQFRLKCVKSHVFLSLF